MRTRALFVAALLACACSTGKHPAPVPTAVQPANIVEGAGRTPITIVGKFGVHVFTDFEDKSSSRANEGYLAKLGDTTLPAPQLESDGSLSTFVPEGLAPGHYDLTVTDPWGNSGTLASAFRVIALSELDEVVTGYRIDPIGPQKAGVPFPITVTAVDSDGAQVPYFNRTLELSDQAGAIDPAVIGYLALGAWTGLVQVDAPRDSDVLTVVDDRQRQGTSNPFAIAARDAAGLRFASDPQVVLAGSCSQVVELRLVDLTGFPLPASAPVSVDLAAEPSDGVTLFSDDGCQASLAAPQIAAGESALHFFFKATRAGRVRLSASSGALSGDEQLETVNAATPVRIAFVSAAQSVAAGACAGPVRVESQDASGNAAVVGMLEAIALAPAPSTGVMLYSDSACTLATSATSLEAGTADATFFFVGTAAGQFTLTATSADLGSDQQTETVVPAQAAQLVFVTAEQTLIQGTCSKAATVECRDAFGNPAPFSSGGTLQLAALPASGFTFSSGADCGDSATSVAFLAGQARATFWFEGSSPQDVTMTASISETISAQQAAHIRPPLPSQLAFVTAAQHLVAGTCSGIATVQAVDVSGTPRAVGADTPVALSVPASASMTFFSDSTCSQATATTTIAAGTDSASFYFLGTRAGSQPVTAAVAAWQGATQSELIDADTAVRVSFRTSPVTAFAGDCSAAITVGLEDGWGNLATPPGSLSVHLVASPPGGFQLFSDASCGTPASDVALDAAQPSGDVHFVSTRAGQVTLLAQATGYGQASQAETVQAKVPTRLVFITPARSTDAGACSLLMAVQSQDALGNPVVAPATTALALTTTAGADFGFYSDGSCTTRLSAPAFAANSDTVTFYARGQVAGTFTVSASAFGTSAQQDAAVGPGNTVRFAWAPIRSPQGQNAPFYVRLEARDAYDNLTPAFAGTASLLVVPPGSATCHDGCTDTSTTGAFDQGVWRGTVAVSAAGTDKLLVAVAGSASSTSAPFDVASAPASSPPVARLSVTPAAIVAGGSVLLDASSSFDYQLDALTASWDPDGSASGTAPWPSSPFASALSASQSFSAAGVYHPRVAVSDGSEIDYAATAVIVVADPSELCVVTTGSDVDDGATDCSDPGPDGVLSLAEAVRIANSSPTRITVAFAGPTTVQGTTALRLTQPTNLAGGKGVVILAPLSIAAQVLLAEVALEGQPVTVEATGALELYDVAWRDSAGLLVQGSLDATHLWIDGCQGACVTDDSASSLAIRFSTIRGAGSPRGLLVKSCVAGASPLELQSVVFSGVDTGVDSQCDRPLSILFATFDGGSLGVQYAGGAGHELANALFTGQATQAAAGCSSATFAQRQYSMFSASAPGCLSGDPGELSADPLYVFREAGDWRLSAGSPAVDAALDLGLDVDAEAPGSYFGAGPDRGGVESR